MNLTGNDNALDSKSSLPGGRTACGQPGGTYTPTSPKRSTVNEPEFDTGRACLACACHLVDRLGNQGGDEADRVFEQPL